MGLFIVLYVFPKLTSLFRDSGVGDFGEDGIKTFLHDHSCGPLCSSLGLKEQVPLNFDISGSEGSDEDT
jgi:hypothetical protein